jgi:predicted glycoside hydrolase/deacetylase ChbG (UPF0249 family)
MRYFLLLLALTAAGQEKKLILHADDLGYSHAGNQASFELLEKGFISSASVMMPTPWVAEVVTWQQKHPKADLGLHLTLTSEWRTMRWGPLAAREKVPGLLDPQGYLWQLVPQVAAKATPAEVEIELRAQIEHARRIGLRFTHLDTHMGTLYSRPDYFQVFEKIGDEFNVPILRIKPGAGNRGGAPQNTIDYITSKESEYQRKGTFRLDDLLTDPARGIREYGPRKEAYWQALRELKPGVTMLIIHPAILSEETTATTGTAIQRDGDYRIFKDEATQRLMRDLNIKLTGWQDVAPRP